MTAPNLRLIQSQSIPYTPTAQDITNGVVNKAITWATPFQDTNYVVFVSLTLTLTAAWQASHVYAQGTAIIDPNLNIEFATTGGTSGSTIPTFSVVTTGTTNDNTAVWTMYAMADILFVGGTKVKTPQGCSVEVFINLSNIFPFPTMIEILAMDLPF